MNLPDKHSVLESKSDQSVKNKKNHINYIFVITTSFSMTVVLNSIECCAVSLLATIIVSQHFWEALACVPERQMRVTKTGKTEW